MPLESFRRRHRLTGDSPFDPQQMRQTLPRVPPPTRDQREHEAGDAYSTLQGREFSPRDYSLAMMRSFLGFSVSDIRGPSGHARARTPVPRAWFPLLRLYVRSNPALGTSVRAYSPRRLLYKSKTGGKSTRSERSQESSAGWVGWRSLSGWVADAGRGARSARGRGGSAVEGEGEVYIGGSGRNRTAVGENARESRIEKGRRHRRGRRVPWQRGQGAGRHEGRGARMRGEGRGRDRETAEVGVKNPTRN